MIDTKDITFSKMLPWGLLLVGIVVILLFVFRAVKVPGKDPVYEYLQHQSDSILKVDRLYVADSVRQKVIDSLLDQVGNKDQRIKTIYKNSEKIIYLYRGISNDSIRRVFADRSRKPS